MTALAQELRISDRGQARVWGRHRMPLPPVVRDEVVDRGTTEGAAVPRVRFDYRGCICCFGAKAGR